MPKKKAVEPADAAESTEKKPAVKRAPSSAKKDTASKKPAAKARKTVAVSVDEVRAKQNSNLKPLDTLDKESAKRIRSEGGKASTAKKKERNTMKEGLKILMEMDPSDDLKAAFAQQFGIPIDSLKTNAMIADAALMGKALSGDVKAWQMIHDTVFGKEVSEDIQIRREELKIQQEKHAMEKADWEEARKPAAEDSYTGIPLDQVAPWFARPYHDMLAHSHKEFVFPGGRGSAKSSGISLAILDLMERNPNLSALVMRNVGNTLSTSVFNQLKWALVVLGLDKAYKTTKNPMQMVKKSTGQTIFFSGADDAGKIKGLKPTNGYVGIIWLEELDQFAGPETVRNLEQSAIRGGDDAWIFKSFNPPKSCNSWANEYTLLPKTGMRVYRSTYKDVPANWLGKDWIEEAEELKRLNPAAYENEYLGEANGNGGSVFDNIEVRPISEEEIKTMDYFLNGVDWGWYPDPFAFVRTAYDRTRRILYILEAAEMNKMSNEQTAEYVKSRIPVGDIVTCDSAEEKSVADYKAFGISARGAEKGPESRRYSYKWLQALVKIVIDPDKAAPAVQEFTHYEYERDKDGNIIEGYPDGADHTIDAVRYATNREWKKKGK